MNPCLAALLLAAAPKWVTPVSLRALTPNSVELDFETDAAVSAHVELATAKGPAGGLTDAQHKARHSLPLEGLQPDTAYTWKLDAGGAQAEGSFRTAPAPGTATPFTFAVVGDSRDHLTWAELAHAILEKHPRFVITTGDSIVGGDSAEQWRDYFVAARELFANTPIYAVQGNHDLGENYARFNPPPSTGIGPSTYAFTYGNAGFVALDSNTPDDSAQRAFVTHALGALSGGPLFVFHHAPLYSCGIHGSDPQLQAAFQPLFEKARVTLDFGGHDHDLIMWEPIHGVRYAVSGGGGTVTYPLHGCRGPFAKKGYGFMLVHVAGAKVSAGFFDAHGLQLYATGTFDAAGPRVPQVDLGRLAHPPR